ncbi:MAG: flagellar assembly protein FliW [Limnochordia bacterium]|jgi:flagellar assembly factor FliW
MLIETSRFGPLEVDVDEIIEFPAGILGFEDYKKYVLLEHKPGSHFRYLQSMEEPELTFVLIDPRSFRPDYRVELSSSSLGELQVTEASEVEVYAIVTIPGEVTAMTANLQAPVLINTGVRLGQQIVLTDGQYGLRHKIMEELAQLPQAQRKTG